MRVWWQSWIRIIRTIFMWIEDTALIYFLKVLSFHTPCHSFLKEPRVYNIHPIMVI